MISVVVGMQSNAYFVMGLTCCFVILLKGSISNHKITRYLGVIAVLNLLLTIILLAIPNSYHGLVAGNKSMNQILNIALFPYMGILSPGFFYGGLVVNLILTLTSRSSCAVASLVVLLTFMVVKDELLSKKTKAGLLAIGGICLSIFTALSYDHLLNGYSRFDAYSLFFRDFTLTDWLIGEGAGSFYTLGIVLQYVNNFTHDGFYIFMHSDFLQLLFEYGVIGAILILPMCVWVFKVAPTATSISLASGS